MATNKKTRTHPKLGQGNFHAIARRAQVNPAHVSRVLRGKRGASFDMASRIAAAADVSLDELNKHIRGSA